MGNSQLSLSDPEVQEALNQVALTSAHSCQVHLRDTFRKLLDILKDLRTDKNTLARIAEQQALLMVDKKTDFSKLILPQNKSCFCDDSIHSWGSRALVVTGILCIIILLLTVTLTLSCKYYRHKLTQLSSNDLNHASNSLQVPPSSELKSTCSIMSLTPI